MKGDKMENKKYQIGRLFVFGMLCCLLIATASAFREGSIYSQHDINGLDIQRESLDVSYSGIRFDFISIYFKFSYINLVKDDSKAIAEYKTERSEFEVDYPILKYLSCRTVSLFKKENCIDKIEYDVLDNFRAVVYAKRQEYESWKVIEGTDLSEKDFVFSTEELNNPDVIKQSSY